MNTASSGNASAPAEVAKCLPFRVLCVDDDHDVADSTVLLLRAVGFEARACYDGRTALQLAAEFRPNVCLLDVNMPGMDGDELAVGLLAQPGWRPLLVVAVTALCDEAYRQRTTAAGFHLYLVHFANVCSRGHKPEARAKDAAIPSLAPQDAPGRPTTKRSAAYPCLRREGTRSRRT